MDLTAGDLFANEMLAMLLVEGLTEMALLALVALLATRAFLVLLRLVIKDFLWMAISFPPRKLASLSTGFVELLFRSTLVTKVEI